MSDGEGRVNESPRTVERHARAGRPRSARDYPQVSRGHLEIAAKLASPLLGGPPMCDELVEFVRHAFTEEEADVAARLRPLLGTRGSTVVKRLGRPLEETVAVLERLATAKRAIGASGRSGARRYFLIPVMPGMFEMVLVGERLESLSPWHRRFAELFAALYETGYLADYRSPRPSPAPILRVLPVGRAIEAQPAALPCDGLEAVLDRFDLFGVGQCQCRIVEAVVGRGCGRPLGNCTAMGRWAALGIEAGWLRKVSRRELLDIKREAEGHGLVNWVLNVEATRGQVSCSCCGCCCHALRTIRDFNVPGAAAPPHFVPRFSAACNGCGRCTEACPMRALEAVAGAAPQWQAVRCIGCGLCAAACNRRAATMEPAPKRVLPYRNWFSAVAHVAPGMLAGAWRAWRARSERSG